MCAAEDDNDDGKGMDSGQTDFCEIPWKILILKPKETKPSLIAVGIKNVIAKQQHAMKCTGFYSATTAWHGAEDNQRFLSFFFKFLNSNSNLNPLKVKA